MHENRFALVKGRDWQSGKPIQVWISESGQIDHVQWLTEQEEHQHWGWIAPGLVDLQLNGYEGIDLNTLPLTIQDVQNLTRRLWEEGVTTYYPTMITNDDRSIEAAVQVIAQACASDPLVAASITGIHLEGPFISPEDGARGAHDKRFVQPPNWKKFEQWQQAARGLIRLVTLSPEWDTAPEFISRCVQNGVAVSIGHTAASPEQIEQAVQAGAKLSTHLGNGAHVMLPRHPNYIWEQLAHDSLWTCAIADGFHLPTSLLKVFMKVKEEQFILVSDAVYLSGLSPGTYETHIGGSVVLTPEGKLHLEGNPKLLAGSVKMLKDGIEHVVRSGLSHWVTAWEMASVRPARLMDLPVQHALAPGAPADLVTLEWKEGKVLFQHVYKRGRRVK
ncbi:N-acetylglucosamine-6-phosphate deacetylase [Marinicrinis lubricantis]|uniref:N-acetylglucosamine-6-phosphate deacetylase n=1 Tax=Marinicrinis lubricantis TaxID=2086470 RepID=A0ABW1IK35_9BACL